MKLLPTLRQKKRYLVWEITADKSFTLEEVEKEVNSALADFLGQLGLAKAAPFFLREKFNPALQRFVLKVGHKCVKEAKAALILIKKIKNTGVIFRCLITTGTLKKASKLL